MGKLWTILKSRFNKNKEEDWVEDRRKICKGCDYNSKNVEIIPFGKRITICLSDFYSWITGKKQEDNLGNCLACQTCSIFYATLEAEYQCKKEKWDNLN